MQKNVLRRSVQQSLVLVKPTYLDFMNCDRGRPPDLHMKREKKSLFRWFSELVVLIKKLASHKY